MTSGETAYLILAIAAFAVFGLVLAWASVMAGKRE